jgi:hypothetical protein
MPSIPDLPVQAPLREEGGLKAQGAYKKLLDEKGISLDL